MGSGAARPEDRGDRTRLLPPERSAGHSRLGLRRRVHAGGAVGFCAEHIVQAGRAPGRQSWRRCRYDGGDLWPARWRFPWGGVDPGGLEIKADGERYSRIVRGTSYEIGQRPMTNPDTDARFTGSVPQIYQQHLVPLIFEPYAAELVSRL